MVEVAPDRTARRAGVRLALAAALLLAGPIPGRPAHAQLPTPTKADLVVVRKAERSLQLMREGRVLATYRIALGPEPRGPKRMEGDGRTPEGVYTLDWRNEDSGFYRSIHVSYPRADDLVPADRWGVSPGGLIMVHGMPNGATPRRVGHPFVDWTNGCIAVTNEEMDEIWARVDDGTPIIIYP
jgi:murein L,D-transpeptidase YafK